MGCDKEAVALLTFAPQQAKAWLYDLIEANPTGGIMLCRRHANATVVPMSWQLIDARDPAWPGPGETAAGSAAADSSVHATTGTVTPALAGEPVHANPAVVVSEAALASPSLQPAMALPSDAGRADTFAAIDGPLQPQPYAEPRAATLRAAGVLSDFAPVGTDGSDADMSLFQLPLSDAPAVTPHPDHR